MDPLIIVITTVIIAICTIRFYKQQQNLLEKKVRRDRNSTHYKLSRVVKERVGQIESALDQLGLHEIKGANPHDFQQRELLTAEFHQLTNSYNGGHISISTYANQLQFLLNKINSLSVPLQAAG